MRISPISTYCGNNLKYTKNKNNLNSVSSITPALTNNISFGMARQSYAEEFHYIPTKYETGKYDALKNLNNGEYSDEELLKLMQELANDETAPIEFKKQVANYNSFISKINCTDNPYIASFKPNEAKFAKAFIDICPDEETLEKMIMGSNAFLIGYPDASKVKKLILDNLDSKKHKNLIGRIASVVFNAENDAEKDKFALEKFKETNPSQEEIYSLLGKRGDLWYPIPSTAKRYPERWDAALKILEVEPIDFQAEKEKYIKAEERKKAIRILNTMFIEEKQSHCREKILAIYPHLTKQEREQIIEQLSFNDLYDSRYSYETKDVNLYNIIPAAEIVRCSSDKSKAVDELLFQERVFLDHDNIRRKHTPFSKTIIYERGEGLCKILDELKDYPQLQFKILTCEECVNRIMNPTRNRYATITDMEGVFTRINELHLREDAITDEQDEQLTKIYNEKLVEYYKNKGIANARAKKQTAGS